MLSTMFGVRAAALSATAPIADNASRWTLQRNITMENDEVFFPEWRLRDIAN
jgi:hypothetical protein